MKQFQFIIQIKKYYRQIAIAFGAIAAVVLFILFYFLLAPSDFPDRKIVTVKSGQYLSQVADGLESSSIIKSPFLFKILVVIVSGNRQVKAADYLFDQPESAVRVAYRLVNGIQGMPKIKVTFFEGMTVKDMGALLKKAIPNFDLSTFIALATPYEGYLFPDTYFFYESTSPQDVIEQLRGTFNEKIKLEILPAQASGHSLGDILKMASIVEREATSTADRKMVAGVLWNRIVISMPLQVDPPFYYLLGKDSSELTLSDLAIDSPYNLYKHTGLPPTPIDNPGLDAIEATISPTKSKYLFYLSDKYGNMHYSEDLNGHATNKRKYIN